MWCIRKIDLKFKRMNLWRPKMIMTDTLRAASQVLMIKLLDFVANAQIMAQIISKKWWTTWRKSNFLKVFNLLKTITGPYPGGPCICIVWMKGFYICNAEISNWMRCLRVFALWIFEEDRSKPEQTPFHPSVTASPCTVGGKYRPFFFPQSAKRHNEKENGESLVPTPTLWPSHGTQQTILW